MRRRPPMQGRRSALVHRASAWCAPSTCSSRPVSIKACVRVLHDPSSCGVGGTYSNTSEPMTVTPTVGSEYSCLRETSSEHWDRATALWQCWHPKHVKCIHISNLLSCFVPFQLRYSPLYSYGFPLSTALCLRREMILASDEAGRRTALGPAGAPKQQAPRLAGHQADRGAFEAPCHAAPGHGPKPQGIFKMAPTCSSYEFVGYHPVGSCHARDHPGGALPHHGWPSRDGAPAGGPQGRA